jgi:uncharacterized protein
MRMVISADSHVLEPADLWTKAIGQKYGAALPQMVHELNGQKGNFFFTGLEYVRLEEVVEGEGETQDTLIQAGKDPAVRVACMDRDHIFAEIVNSTWMLYAMRAKNDDMVRACCTVFNDWLGEYCSGARGRLFGTAMVHMENVGWAVQELQRAAKKGLRSVIINCDARPNWKHYQDSQYDPFWACAQELDMPVTLHIITGNEVDLFTLHGADRINVPRSALGVFREAGDVLANEFIFGGIFDRFPKLKVMCSEFEVSWLPYWLFRIKQVQKDFGPALGIPKIKRPVTEYLGQIYHGTIDDEFLDRVLDVVDPKTILWGSDFPHARCTYPKTLEIIDRVFGKIAPAMKSDLTLRNAARVYNIAVPATVTDQ